MFSTPGVSPDLLLRMETRAKPALPKISAHSCGARMERDPSWITSMSTVGEAAMAEDIEQALRHI